MKRTTKNIIMIILIILTITSISFTMYYAKNHVTTSASGEMMTPPNGIGNETGNPPDKPDGDNNQEANTPPDKPDGDNNQEANTPPEKPSDDGNSDNERPQMPNDNGNNQPSMNTPNGNTTSSISTGYYVVFAIEGLILSILVMYLIMSNCNKKSLKETFANKDKIVISVLSIVILTSLTTLGSSVITNNVLLKNNENNNIQNNQNNGESGATYSSNTSITEDATIKDKEYTSSTSEENALSISKAEVTLDNVTITKTGDSTSGDNSNFYGTNSAIIAKDGATITIKNSKITTNADGANGVFSYGGSATTNNSSSDGTTINISDTKITTTGDNAGGIMTTGGGTTNAKDLTIKTSGTSSAAIRSDRGGGTVTVDGGTYKTTGKGSPSIYSTADITVSNATLTSTASEGVVIEGKNSVTLENVTLTDTNNTLNGQSTTYKNIFLYQSMSGDAADGEAKFTAKNSKITTNKGDTLYVTNTTASITLENNTIVNTDKSGNFLRIQKDSWGTSGSNGGNVTLTLKNQSVTGNIVVDNISTLDMTLTSKSYFEGAINTDNIAKSITLKLDKNSKIKLTSNTYVTSLEDADTTYSNIDLNGYKLYVNGVELSK